MCLKFLNQHLTKIQGTDFDFYTAELYFLKQPTYTNLVQDLRYLDDDDEDDDCSDVMEAEFNNLADQVDEKFGGH